MNSRSKQADKAYGYATPEEELETGELIPDEDKPPAKKIPALKGKFNGRASRRASQSGYWLQNRAASARSGRMVCRPPTSAKEHGPGSREGEPKKRRGKEQKAATTQSRSRRASSTAVSSAGLSRCCRCCVVPRGSGKRCHLLFYPPICSSSDAPSRLMGGSKEE